MSKTAELVSVSKTEELVSVQCLYTVYVESRILTDLFPRLGSKKCGSIIAKIIQVLPTENSQKHFLRLSPTFTNQLLKTLKALGRIGNCDLWLSVQ